MHRLALLALGAILGAEAAAVEDPPYLEGPAQKRFAEFRDRPEHRAFALGPRGAWGMAYGHADPAAARRAALGFCREHANECAVIAVDNRLVAESHPFAETRRETGNGRPETVWYRGISAGTARWLAIAGLVFLVAGTLFAERHPLMARSAGRGPLGTGPIRTNYTYVMVTGIYFLALMPTFARTASAVTGDPLTWIPFGAPILPPAVAALYLQAKGRLGERAGTR